MSCKYKGLGSKLHLMCMLLVGSTLFTSCAEDSLVEDEMGQQSEGRQEIRFSYATPSVTRGENLELQGDALSDGLKTGIYVRAPKAEDCTHNVMAQADETGRLKLMTTVYYPEEEEGQVSAFAYAPYQEDWATTDVTDEDWNRKTFTVQTDQRTDEGVINSDLLWAEPIGGITNPFRTKQVVKFGFRHLLTKVMVTLSIDKMMIKSFGTIKVEMLNTKTSCTLDLQTGEVSESVLPQTVLMADMELTPNDVLTAEGNAVMKKCCAIVVPQTVEPGADLFRVTLPDGTERIATQPENLRSEYRGGVTFNYGLSLSDMVVLDGITEGEEVDLGLSSIWANRNVGADKPEDFGGLYGWADPTGALITIDDNAYPSADPPLEISGTEYDIARAQWGGTWRLPTLADFEELKNMCTWKWGTYNGVWGCKVTGPSGNSIFLPAAGMRMGNTTQMVGTGGFYGAGTLDTKTSTGKKAVHLAFSGTTLEWLALERYYGQSMRPVKDK